jgi:hypothetical protein
MIDYVVTATDGLTDFLPVAVPGTGGKAHPGFNRREDAERYVEAAKKLNRPSLTYRIEERQG